MNAGTHNIPRRSQGGVALLIALFALLLISAAAIALILMAGTESAIDSNYRTSNQAFYDAFAGIEEARGRLWAGNPSTFGSFMPSPMPLGTVRYIINAPSGVTVNPTNLTSSNPYQDTEYQQEWGVAVTSASVQTTTSSSAVAGLAGPLYEWVRVTPKTEQSGNIDVNGDGTLDNTQPLYYDGKNQYLANQIPANATAFQVLRVTALAVLPNGSRRMLQYDVAPIDLNLTFPAALTLDGSGATYSGPNSNPFNMSGVDRSGSNTIPCTTPSQPTKPAIGDVNSADTSNIISGIPSNRQSHYTGTGSTPSVGNVSSQLTTGEQTVAGLDGTNGLVETIYSVATETLGPPPGTDNLSTTYTSLPDYGSQSNPQIVVVNGNLSISGNVTGYGILVVTGSLSFGGTDGWNGAVLVIGQGSFSYSGGGNNQFDGAVFVAKTRDASNNLLSSLGAPSVSWAGGGGDGIYYDSCWLTNAQSGLSYTILSFREISQ